MRTNEPAAFRGEATAGAVLRHGLHYVSDVQCDRIRQVNTFRVSCCPQGRGDNSEWLAVNWRLACEVERLPEGTVIAESSLSEDD